MIFEKIKARNRGSNRGFFRGVAIVFVIAGVLALLYRLLTSHWIGG